MSCSSSARNAASPKRSKYSSIVVPTRSSSRRSLSSAVTPSAAAASRAAVDLPAPMKPMKTIAGRVPAAVSAVDSVMGSGLRPGACATRSAPRSDRPRR